MVVCCDHTCAEVGLEVIPPEAEVLVPVGPHLEGGGWGKLSLCDELVLRLTPVRMPGLYSGENPGQTLVEDRYCN